MLPIDYADDSFYFMTKDTKKCSFTFFVTVYYRPLYDVISEVSLIQGGDSIPLCGAVCFHHPDNKVGTILMVQLVLLWKVYLIHGRRDAKFATLLECNTAVAVKACIVTVTISYNGRDILHVRVLQYVTIVLFTVGLLGMLLVHIFTCHSRCSS